MKGIRLALARALWVMVVAFLLNVLGIGAIRLDRKRNERAKKYEQDCPM